MKKVLLVRTRGLDSIERIINEKLSKLRDPRVINFIFIPGVLVGDNVLVLIEYEG